MAHVSEQVCESVEAIDRSRSRRNLATWIRLPGDVALAEDPLHLALAAALERWPREGVPANPPAWLISTARFKVIHALPPR
jgi:RNA polymerase sigma-70 factor, ECF subfamily